jgi:hypothetical protein
VVAAAIGIVDRPPQSDDRIEEERWTSITVG